jgi:hypothetical protein
VPDPKYIWIASQFFLEGQSRVYEKEGKRFEGCGQSFGLQALYKSFPDVYG